MVKAKATPPPSGWQISSKMFIKMRSGPALSAASYSRSWVQGTHDLPGIGGGRLATSVKYLVDGS
jgi:hypothetical protein